MEAAFQSIAASSLVSVLPSALPTHTFSAATVLKPFHTIKENSKIADAAGKYWTGALVWLRLQHQPAEIQTFLTGADETEVAPKRRTDGERSSR